MAPNPLKCLKTGCEWVTPPNCPTWADQIELMKIHTSMEHPREQGAAAGGVSRQEKLPRPKLEAEISETEFQFFENKWERYKRSTNLEGQGLIDQLWECASEDLQLQCHGAGADHNTSEKDLLALLRLCSIRAQNNLVNIVEFLNMKQEADEPITKFITRVKCQAKVCHFSMQCPKRGCDQEVSYSEKLVSHVVVKGIEDPVTQERVLAMAAETEEKDLTLKKISEFVYAQESAIRSRKLLGGGESSLNRISQHRKNQRNRSSTLPSNTEKCQFCGRPGHGAKPSLETRKEKCPAFSKNCNKCGTPGHFAHKCKQKKKHETNSLEDRGSVSDTAEVDSFGFFSMTAPPTRPRHKVRNLRGLNHHAVDAFGKWKERAAEHQPETTVEVAVCMKGYEEVGVTPPRRPHTTTSKCLPDTGAQMCVAGLDLVHQLGVKKGELFPVAAGIRAANGGSLGLIGGLLVTISGMGADGDVRYSNQMVYISENLKKLFLSKECCGDLGIIGKRFPEIGSADNEESSNFHKCEFINPKDPSKCECPTRVPTPDPPKSLPMPATEENIPKLKEFLIQYYSDSAFNTCESQSLPLMRDSPPMRLHVDKNAKPVAFHKPYPIPLHFQKAVKEQLDNDVKMGVLGKVEVGEKTEWCSRMIVLPKKDPTKPRRVVDFQHLNNVCARQTHVGKSPFHQVLNVLSDSWKSCYDAKDGYHSVPIHEED